MSVRKSRNDVEQLLERIQGYARALDLLPPDGELTWLPGNTARNHAPAVGVTVHSFRNGSRYLDSGTAFLPDFQRGYKTTISEAWLILSATAEALAAVVHYTERAGLPAPEGD